MKKLLFLALILSFASCSNDKDNEDFSPYPGGKNKEVNPKT